jgi:hypothetical protein
MDQWLQQGELCPSCNNKYFPAKVARFAMNELNSTKFKCDKCEEVFSYEGKDEHQTNTCKTLRINCPLKCGRKDFINKVNLQNHLADECPESPMICQSNDPKVMTRNQMLNLNHNRMH